MKPCLGALCEERKKTCIHFVESTKDNCMTTCMTLPGKFPKYEPKPTNQKPAIFENEGSETD